MCQTSSLLQNLCRGGLLVATPIGDRKVARSNPTSLKLRYQRSGLTTPTSFKPRFIRRGLSKGLIWFGSRPRHPHAAKSRRARSSFSLNFSVIWFVSSHATFLQIYSRPVQHGIVSMITSCGKAEFEWENGHCGTTNSCAIRFVRNRPRKMTQLTEPKW